MGALVVVDVAVMEKRYVGVAFPLAPIVDVFVVFVGGGFALAR